MEVNKKKDFTVDDYFARFPEEVQEGLEQIRQAIKRAAPTAQECISYQMPAFKYLGMLAWYAAYKNHYGLYVSGGAYKAYSKELAAYECSKATLRIPIDQRIPKKLITDIVRFKKKENEERKGRKN
jgi:uncharacterized protein YdhG (YjbR/CyaY superfamily)